MTSVVLIQFPWQRPKPGNYPVPPSVCSRAVPWTLSVVVLGASSALPSHPKHAHDTFKGFPLSFYKNIFDFEWHLCSRISIPGRDVLEPSSGIVYVQLCPDKGSLWCWGWRGTAGKMMPLFMGKHQFPTGILLQEGQKYKITPQLRKQKPGLAVQEIVMQKTPTPGATEKNLVSCTFSWNSHESDIKLKIQGQIPEIIAENYFSSSWSQKRVRKKPPRVSGNNVVIWLITNVILPSSRKVPNVSSPHLTLCIP